MMCALQTHLYEDRVMKIGRIEIGGGVTVGAGSTVLYDTHFGEFARLGPLTVVMKGEKIPAIPSGSARRPSRLRRPRRRPLWRRRDARPARRRDAGHGASLQARIHSIT